MTNNSHVVLALATLLTGATALSQSSPAGSPQTIYQPGEPAQTLSPQPGIQALPVQQPLPSQQHSVQPVVSDVTISQSAVVDVHLRPLYTTTIRMPDAISSVAIGAPTLFQAEHSEQEPRLVYVKPSTKQHAESNLVVTMRSGETISMRLLSDGAMATNAPVDFIVDYRPQQSFFIGSADAVTHPETESASATPVKRKDSMELALEGQARVATPDWQKGTTLDDTPRKNSPPALTGVVGEVSESDGSMLVAYSVKNETSHWIEVLPPQIEINSPGAKDGINSKQKKHVVLAEQVPVREFKVNGRKLAPGQRVDGVVAFERPTFKQSQEQLLLQVASANSVDRPLLLAVPFVAPTN